MQRTSVGASSLQLEAPTDVLQLTPHAHASNSLRRLPVFQPEQRLASQELLGHGFLKPDNCASRQHLAAVINENRKQ